MNWEIINNGRSSLQEYRLIDNNDCKLIIKYNPRHQSARLTSGNHHRLFFLENSGSSNGKTIFKNEYGMEIGNLVHDRFDPKEGTLVIDSKKYQYHLQSDAAAELVIYENDAQKPVANCSIPAFSKNALQNIVSAGTQAVENSCYLLGLCWYLFLPFVKENIFRYTSPAF